MYILPYLSSALSPPCDFLIPCLLSAEVFPHASAISLHLLDLEGDEDGLQQLRKETEDLAVSLLHQVWCFLKDILKIISEGRPIIYIYSQVTIHTDLERAFQEADVILLLDEGWTDDSDAENEEEKKEKKKLLKRVSDRHREYGRLIDARANKEVKVIVSGDSCVNLRCSLLLDSAPSIDSRQFVTMATRLENEARAVLAKQLKVRTSGSCCKVSSRFGETD